MESIKKFSKNNFLLLTLLLIFLILNAFVFMMIVNGEQLIYILLILATSLLFGMPLLYAIWEFFNGKPVLKLIYIACLFLFFNYPLRGAYLIFKNHGLLRLMGNLDYYNYALFIALIGGAFFLLSYSFFPVKKIKMNFLQKNWNEKKLKTILLSLYFLYVTVSILTIIFIKDIFTVPEIVKSSLCVAFSILSPIVIILTFINKFEFQNKIKVFWMIIFPLQIIMAFAQEYKEYLLMPIIYFFILVLIYRKKINYKLLFGAIIVFFLVIIIMTPLRENKLSELDNPIYVKNLAYNSFLYPINRMHALDSLAVISKQTEEGGEFKRGETLLLLPYSFVPRIFWSNKPIIPLGRYFAKEYLGKENVSIGVSAIGDLYWNFGIFSVIIGMIVFGLALKYSSLILETKSMTPSKALILSLILYYIAIDFVLESIAAALSGLIKTIIFVIPIIYYLNKRE